MLQAIGIYHQTVGLGVPIVAVVFNQHFFKHPLTASPTLRHNCSAVFTKIVCYALNFRGFHGCAFMVSDFMNIRIRGYSFEFGGYPTPPSLLNQGEV